MKIKTNVRAGQGGADNSADTSTSSNNQKQKGKDQPVVTPPVSRCVGL